MNKEINFDSWQTPKLSEKDKQDLLRKIRNVPEKKRFFEGVFLVKFVPVMVTALVLVVVGLGFLFWYMNSLEYRMAKVQRLLDEEVTRHREYIYFAENLSRDWQEEEVEYEKDVSY